MKKLGLGMMRLPLTDPDKPESVDLDHARRMVDAFLERGFTYFDTAYMYHNYRSEDVVRQTLVERYPRESFLLADKLPLSQMKESTAEDQERIFNEQLKKCGVDYFDYYLLHNMGVYQYETAKRLDSFAFLRRLKAEGRAKRIGFSYHDSAALLDDLLTAHPEVDVVQLQLNYADWDSESVQSRLCYEVCVKHGKPVVVMEPVKGGRLANLPEEAEALLRNLHPDWSAASWAIRYAADLDNVMVVLSGMSSLEQLLDNTGHMADPRPLTAGERQAIDQVTEVLRKLEAVPCTGCRYCVEGCPQRIPIPAYFSLFNAVKGKPSVGQQVYYDNYCKDGGRASDCAACGQCEEACPQHIQVVKWLKEVAAAYERQEL